ASPRGLFPRLSHAVPSGVTPLQQLDDDDTATQNRDRGRRMDPLGGPESDWAPSTPLRGVLLLTRSDMRCLLDLATDGDWSETVATAVHEATRGDSRRAEELLGRVRMAAPAHIAAKSHVFRREGDYWTIIHQGRVLRLRDTKGLRYLARLLHQPEEPVCVTELTGATAAINGAGLERARLAVTKAIRAALARIQGADPELGRYLTATVRRGYGCVYRPDSRSPIRWTE